MHLGYLVGLSQQPFFAVSVASIDLVYCERVDYALQYFDLVLIDSACGGMSARTATGALVLHPSLL